MGLGCGMSMVKYLLFLFNLLCALCGIAIITIGAIMMSKVEDLDSILKDHSMSWTPIALIVVGSAIFVIAFFGCCGAIRESHCMTVTYGTFLMILLIAKIVIAVFIFVNADEFSKAMEKSFDKVWESGKLNADDKSLELIQQTLKCCGKESPLDWGLLVPKSCCAKENLVGDVCVIGVTSFKKGCKPMIVDFVNGSATLVGAVILGVAGVELLGFIFSCCLANSIRNNKRRSAYA